jgi:hypothetical protein
MKTTNKNDIVRCIILMILLVNSSSSIAQYYTPNSFVSNPLSFNPAFAGLFNNDIRANASFWQTSFNTVNKPQNSIAGSLDLPLLRDLLSNGDAFGLGFLFVQQKNMDEYFINNSYAGLYSRTVQGLGIAFSYHKSIDKNKLHRISSGFRLINATSNYGIQDDTISWFSSSYVNMGLLYSACLTKKIGMYLGVNYNNDKFTDAEMYIGVLQAHLGSTVKIGDKFMIFGNIHSVYDTRYLRFQGMGYVRLSLNSNFESSKKARAIYFGAGYSQYDGLLPYVAIEYNNYRLGCTFLKYFKETSLFNDAKSGFEISLIYNGKLPFNERNNYKPKWNIPTVY